MAELANLSHEEKVFLAGCIRAIITADGAFQTSELDDLDRIDRRLGFDDYEACLDEFEDKVDGEEAFMKEAGGVTNPEAQDIILGVAYELSLQNGVPDDSQVSLEKKLRRLWRRA